MSKIVHQSPLQIATVALAERVYPGIGLSESLIHAVEHVSRRPVGVPYVAIADCLNLKRPLAGLRVNFAHSIRSPIPGLDIADSFHRAPALFVKQYVSTKLFYLSQAAQP